LTLFEFMNLNTLTVVLGQTGAPPPPQAPGWITFVPVALMIVVFYFIMIRPQSKKAKEHAALLKTLRPGDKVVTGSGIIGTVVSVKDKSVSLRSAETKLEVLKSTVSEITERSGSETTES
ncbi:MAG: yajC, partial [Pedosphaera sp.]|nr:yajC [Pedosphaera sp.]